MTPTVTLTPLEVAWALDLAKFNVLNAMLKGLQNKAGARALDSDGVMKHVNGALAELAVARYLGEPPPLDLEAFHDRADLPPDIEVRWAQAGGRLIIRPSDPPERRYVSVTGFCPVYRIHGWFTKEDCLEEWIHNYGGNGPAWFVPRTALYRCANRRLERDSSSVGTVA